MDWEVREIEKYFLTKKDPKNLYNNVKNMTPQELRDIVKYINNIYKLKKNSLKKISYLKLKHVNNFPMN